MRKGQASAEFLIVIAIMGVAILPLILVMAQNAQSTPEKLAMSEAQFSTARLGAAVDSVGSMGPGAQMRTQVQLPGLLSLAAGGREITARVQTSYGPVDIVQATKFNVSGPDLAGLTPEGTYLILVRASTDPKSENVTLSLG
ncbi:MAG: hypothetical protein KGH63_02975 [Candidatus Micrarchaeota archaeon]|nr:hypothetical protein [Candidatus Micrarchaeota archaeon]